jgi:hypothetical protein
MSGYFPCIPGISITGIDDDKNAFFTIANFPGESRAAFERLRELKCVDGEPEDCLIDLFEQDGMSDNIPITRQMVQRAILALSAPAQQKEAGGQ